MTFQSTFGPFATAAELKARTLDNTIVVKRKEDLIDLQAGITYFIDGTIDMEDTQIEVPSSGIRIVSDSINSKGLFSSADNYTMFKTKAGDYAGNIELSAMFVAASGTNSKLFDLDNDGNFSACEFIDVNIGNFGYGDTTEIGSISDYRQFRAIGCGFINCDDGITFNGTMSGGIVVESSIALSLPAMTLLKEGTSLSIQGSFRSDINFLSTDAATVLCDFQESNIVQDGGFSLTNVRTDATDIVPNLSSTSVKSRFRNCNGIRNTYVGGQFIITTSATTTITAVNTPTKVAGTTTYSDLNWFTGANSNEFVYVSDQLIEVELKGLMTFTGGNNDQIELWFRKWDNSASAYVDLPKTQATLNGGLLGTRAEGVGIFGYTELDENDRIEVWVQNISDNSNVTALQNGLVSIIERPS